MYDLSICINAKYSTQNYYSSIYEKCIKVILFSNAHKILAKANK